MNRWTEAHAMAGFGLRQVGAMNSLQCLHLKPIFSLSCLLSNHKDVGGSG